MNKIYIKIKGGDEYYEYGYIPLKSVTDNNYKVKSFAIRTDFDTNKILISKSVGDIIKNMSFPSPAKSSKLKLKDGSPYAAADIRKNYGLVKKVDKADYIVFTKDKIIPTYYPYSQTTIVFPKAKVATLIYYYYYHTDLSKSKVKEFARKAISSLYAEDLLDECVLFDSIYTDVPDSYDDIIKACLGISGDVNKLAEYDSLDMCSGEDVTLDSLKILKGALYNKSGKEKEEENAKVALMAFHNFNYRKVPGTMDRFMSIMADSSYLVREMNRHPSVYPKPIREILEEYGYRRTEFADKNDYELFYQFVESIMEVEDVKVVSHKDYDRKIARSPMSEDMFSEMYDVMVRITRKKYEDYISAKQNGNTAC